MSVNIRAAHPQDLPQVYDLIKELALYENEPNEPTVSLEVFVRDGSGNQPKYRVIVAEEEHEIIGIALYYLGYSTWKGSMMYLDDLVVRSAHRNKGIGQLLFQELIEKSKEHQVNQLRWHVLDWNKPAISFYNKLNASLEAEWITCKLEKDKLYLS
ncbi:MAG TPA: GNAT family N-acetyltransferase [Chitinophagales bacterium]|nr:GNAT family N-acetyltransferase [Chitinophagales bacterium]